MPPSSMFSLVFPPDICELIDETFPENANSDGILDFGKVGGKASSLETAMLMSLSNRLLESQSSLSSPCPFEDLRCRCCKQKADDGQPCCCSDASASTPPTPISACSVAGDDTTASVVLCEAAAAGGGQFDDADEEDDDNGIVCCGAMEEKNTTAVPQKSATLPSNVKSDSSDCDLESSTELTVDSFSDSE